uniref:hypothetical protein n=1 Tax=Acinetobacter baumannii TaxID=470 RepID=UPI000810A1E7
CTNRKWSKAVHTLGRKNVGKLANRPCTSKGTEFKEEQCSACLINQDAPQQILNTQTDVEKFLVRAYNAQKEI